MCPPPQNVQHSPCAANDGHSSFRYADEQQPGLTRLSSSPGGFSRPDRSMSVDALNGTVSFFGHDEERREPPEPQRPLQDEPAVADENLHFLQKVGSWFQESFNIEEPRGEPPSAAAAASGRREAVHIDCSELGGASRSVSWSMPPASLVRDAREAAAQRLGVRVGECLLLHAGRELTVRDMDAPLSALVEPGTPLKLQMAGGLHAR